MPIARFQLEDGRVARFQVPDGTSPEQAQSMMSSFDFGGSGGNVPSSDDPSSNTDTPSFGDKVFSDLQKRTASAQEAKGPLAARALHLFSQGVGLVGDTAADAAGSIAGPETTASFNDKVGRVAQAVADSQIGRATKTDYDYAKANYPIATQVAGDAANIGANFFGLGSGKAVGTAAKDLANITGNDLIQGGKRILAEKAADHAQVLTTPKLVGQAKKDAAAKVVESDGRLRTQSIAPNARDTAIADAALEAGVSDKNSLVKNRQLIQSADTAEAQSLKDQLDLHGQAIPDDAILNSLGAARDEIAAKNYARGGKGAGTSAAEDTANTALDIVSSHPQTASGMLQARKDFDAWVKAQEGEAIFDPAKDKPLADAVERIRQNMNDLTHQYGGGVDVKASLQKQSNLKKAVENINTKIDPNGGNRITRGISAVTDKLPNSMAERAGLAAAAAGVGLAGAGAPVAAAAAIPYAGYKLATSGTVRKGLGKAVNATAAAHPIRGEIAGMAAVNASGEIQPDTVTTIEPMSQSAVVPSYGQKLAKIESSNNPNAKASTSSATGLAQFTDSTWQHMVRKYGPRFGLTRDGRTDPQQAMTAAELYSEENAPRLRQSLGRDPEPYELYTAHFLGAGGASKLLSADPRAVAAQLLPSAAASNKSIFVDKDGKPRTVGQVKALIQSKWDKA